MENNNYSSTIFRGDINSITEQIKQFLEDLKIKNSIEQNLKLFFKHPPSLEVKMNDITKINLAIQNALANSATINLHLYESKSLHLDYEIKLVYENGKTTQQLKLN